MLLACLTSQQHAGVSQGRICSDKCTCYHTQLEVAYQTFYLTRSQYTDTGTTSPSADHVTPGAWQGKPLVCQFQSHWSDWTRKKSPRRKRESNRGSASHGADALTTRPTRRVIWAKLVTGRCFTCSPHLPLNPARVSDDPDLDQYCRD